MLMERGTKKRTKWIRVVSINILILVVMVEIISQVYYRIKTGHTVYSIDSKLPQIGDSQIDKSQPEVPTAETKIELHPYFGYVGSKDFRWDFEKYCESKPCVESLNSSGFFSLYDYPFEKRSEKHYIIGIFGGSVSVRLLSWRHRLIERLEDLEQFKDREIVVLSFGFGGYKQPQQLQVLSYFLSVGQVYDLVINVDGFNEVGFAQDNVEQGGIDITMPYWKMVKPVLQLMEDVAVSPEKLDVIIGLIRERNHANVLAYQINSTPLASVRLFLEYRYSIALREYENSAKKYTEVFSKSTSSRLYHLDRAPVDMETQLYERVAAQWAESSTLMNDMLKSRGIPYFHFLQPNQHYTKRKSREEGSRAASLSESEYRNSVQQGYPILLKYTERLLENGVNFYSAVDAFEGESRPIYIDSCCHYTKLGNEILIDFIFDRIMESGILKEYESA